jgi:glucose/arabinose dehydrogenase
MTLRSLQLGLVLALAACGSAPSGNADAKETGTPQDPAQPFRITKIATFDSPWAMAFLPGSTDALVTEKGGQIWLIDVANGQTQPVAGVPAVVDSDQGGLLDIAVSPQFGSDRLVYLTYAEPSPNGGSGLALARAQFVQEGGGGRLQNLQVIWRDPEGGDGGQFGARIAFAPDGKSLFLSSGERQRFTPAQDPSSPLGKILHLSLDGKPAPGNPWGGKLGAATVTVTNPPEDTEAAKHASGRTFHWPGPNLTPAETWTLGHRNPYGLAFAPDGRLWEAEAGPKGGDELNLIEPGKNYGWPLVSEGENYDGVPIPRSSTRPDLVPPKLSWTPTITPGGMIIYTGRLFPQWKGDALIPGLNGEALIHVRIRGANAAKADRWDFGHRLRGIAQGPDGAVYILEDGSGAKLLKLTPSS